MLNLYKIVVAGFGKWIKGLLVSYFILLTSGMLMFVFTDTRLETLIVWLLRLTPGIGFRETYIHVDNTKILYIFAVWGTIIGVLISILENVLKVKINFSKQHTRYFLIALFISALMKFIYLFGFDFNLIIFVIIPFLFGMLLLNFFS